MRSIIYMLFALALAMVASCRSRVFTEGENEKKPALGNPLYIPDSNERDVAVFHGVYDVTVRSRKTHEVVCEGTAQIEASLGNTVITGTVPCKTIGAKELVIGDGKKKEKVDLDIGTTKKEHLDTRIRRVIKDGDAEYSPYMPDLIGPIIQDPEKYKDIDFTQKDIRVKLKTDDPKKPYEYASGSVHVKMLGINQTYRPKNFPTTFTNVVHYQINSTDFDGLSDKSAAKIYQVYEHKWAVQPMRLLNVHIEGPVGDFEKSVFKGFLGNIVAFAGGLIIDMDLKELIPISDTPLQEAIQKQH